MTRTVAWRRAARRRFWVLLPCALTIGATMVGSGAAEARATRESGSLPGAVRRLAVERLEKQRAEAQAKGDFAREANALTLLGLATLEDESTSRDYFEKAMERYSRAGDSLAPAVLALSLGLSAKERLDEAGAEVLLRRAAKLAAALPRPLKHVFREPEDGIERLLWAMRLATKIPWKPAERIEKIPSLIEGLARGTLAEILVRRGRFEEAREEVRRVLALSSDLGGVFGAISRQLLDYIEKNKDDPKWQVIGLLEESQRLGLPLGSKAAEEMFLKAKRLLTSSLVGEDRAKVLGVLSLLARNANRPEEAVALLAEAEKLLPSLPPFLHGLRSVLFSDLGAPARGLRAASDASKVAADEKDLKTAEALRWLSIAQGDEAGDPEKMEAFEKVLATVSDEEAAVLRDLMKAAAAADDETRSPESLVHFAGLLANLLPPGGMESFQKFLKAYKEVPTANLEGLGRSALQELANQDLEAMAEDNPGRKQMLMLRSGLLAQEGKLAEAIEVARQLADSAEERQNHLRLDEFSLNIARETAKSFEPLIELEIAAGRTEDAFMTTERARASTLLRWLGGPRADPRAKADPALLARLDAVTDRLKALEPADDRESLANVEALRDERDDLLLRLKLLQPEYSELPVSRLATVSQIRAALPEDATLVSFFTLPGKTIAWILDRESLASFELSPSREQLGQDVERFRSAIAAGGYPAVASDRSLGRGVEVVDPGLPEARSLSQDLYRSLIAPLLPHLRSSRLLLVPHGVLQRLPWGALQDPGTERYLIQDHALSLLPAAGALVAGAGSVPREPRSPGAIPALVFGDPASGIPGLPPLPAARREAEGVARVLGVRAKVGAEARESTLRRDAASLSLLHLAVHGEQDPKAPRASYLALAPDAEQDGRLEMGEIFDELRLQQRPLVVLSACQTGLGKRAGGDEIEGMIRAFLFAGAGGVVATLWSIDDEASALLIDSLYRHLAAGRSAAEALREAQKAMIEHPKYGAPFYWAGYAFTGDPRTSTGIVPRSEEP